jgi:hypothetical protein
LARDVVAFSLLNRVVQSPAESNSTWRKHPQSSITMRDVLKKSGGPISRSIVDYDVFEIFVALLQNARNGSGEIGRPVVDSRNNANAR